MFLTSTCLIISVPLILISLSITNGTMKKLVQMIPNQLYCKYPRFSYKNSDIVTKLDPQSQEAVLQYWFRQDPALGCE